MRVPDPLLRHRAEFPILEQSTYLISNSLGVMPRAAAARREVARSGSSWSISRRW